MRNLITDYSFEHNSRTIVLDKFDKIDIENIRLIVNETQKVVICSSMQKDNIVNIEGNKITYKDDLPALVYDGKVADKLTIEVDMGVDIIYAPNDFILDVRIEKGEGATPHYVIDGEFAKKMSRDDFPIGYVWSYLFSGSPIKEVRMPELISMKNNSFYYTFESSSVEFVDFRNLKSIMSGAGNRTFKGCGNLISINLDSLESIYPEYTCQSMFQDSGLREIILPNLTYISGGTSICDSMFAGCTKLARFIAPKLQRFTAYQSGFSNMFSNCASLYEVDLRSLTTIRQASQTANNFNNTFFNCNNLKLFRINTASLGEEASTHTFMSTATAITDLYLYGVPANNIYLSWQGSLNFNSVCGVLRKLCENTKASGLVCAFKSNFPAVQDVKSYTYIDGDGVETPYTNETGVLKALYEEATSYGWDIQNLKINPVE